MPLISKVTIAIDGFVSRLTASCMQQLQMAKNDYNAMINSIENNDIQLYLDDAPFAILLIDNGMNICYCNNILSKWFGPKAITIGGPLSDDIPAEIQRQINNAVNSVFISRRALSKLFDSFCGAGVSCFQLDAYLSGEKVMVQLRKDTGPECNIENSNGSIKETYAKYINIIDNAKEAIIVARNQKIIYANERSIELFGYSHEEIRKVSFVEFIHPDDRLFVAEQHKKRLMGLDPDPDYMFRIISKQQLIRWVEIHSQLIEWDGAPASLSFVNDITEKKSAQDKLERERNFSQTLIQASPAFLVAIAPNGETIMMSQAMLKALGYEIEEVFRSDYLKTFVPVEERDQVADILDKLITKRLSMYSENTIIAKDNTKLLMEWHGRPVYNENGELDYILGFGNDITQKRKAEREISRSKALLEAAIDQAPFASLIIEVLSDGSSKLLMYNDEAKRMFGDVVKWYQNNDPPFVLHDSAGNVLENEEKPSVCVLNGQSIKNRELVICNPDEEIWVEASSSPIIDNNGNIMAAIVIYKDITKRKNAERELKKSEEKYRNVIENSGEALVVLKDKKIEFYNPRFLEFIGYSSEELKNIELSQLINEDDKDLIDIHYQNKVSGNQSRTQYIVRLVTKGGVNRWVQISSVGIIWEGEYASLGFLTDISGIINAEERLHIKDSAIQSALQAICMADVDGKITYCNNSMLMLWHVTDEKELLSHPLSKLSNDRKFNELLEVIEESGGEIGEATATKIDGTEFYVQYSLSLVHNHAGEPVQIMCSFIDITARRKAEEQLEQLNAELEQKVIDRTAELNDVLVDLENTNVELFELNKSVAKESIKLVELNDKLIHSEHLLKEANETKDKFISIIAHDLKNPLQALILNADLLQRFSSVFDKSKIEHRSAMIYEVSMKINDLLENLLTWSRSQANRIAFEPEPLDIYGLTEETLKLFTNNIIEKKLKVLVHNSSIRVHADRNMVSTILRNLISNAIKFTAEKGSIIINYLISGSVVTIGVKDSGVGIAEADIDKLFRIDVSHSTKGTNSETGTGLGLLITKEFVEKHDGIIEIKSQPGMGTEIIFTLPAFQPNLDKPEPKKS